ncbi:DMT family transporter [Poseidonibacter antarcticus]|uniref:DMT family transporter n=1 Tax=Poseidonibacter antarcticus TaxID=2478538 RepID=UPI000EF51B5A|nr:DMT family transporter [Poseidonibacter antarcticus]
MTKEFKAHLYVLLATFLVGGSFIISEKLSGIIDPISITLYRFVIASVCLAPLIFLKQKYRVKLKNTFKRAMIISFFYSVFFIGMFNALEYTSAINIGTIFTLTPLLTGILSIFIFKQYISKKQYLIYLIGIVGTCIVVFKGDLSLFLSMSLNKGDIIFLFSIISMALYLISTKLFYKEDDELLVVVFLTLVGGIIWMGLVLLFLDIPLEWEKIQGELFIYMLYLSIPATLITVYLFQRTTIVLGPSKVMAYSYLNPATVAILLFIFEAKIISFEIIIGILISSIATFILLKKR